MLEFAGAAVPLSLDDISQAAAQIDVPALTIRAVDQTESRGFGFLQDKRPKILFEAHQFGRLTQYQWNFEHPNISSSQWNRSLYGAAGAHQYDRLAEAIRLNRNAALQAASWGRYQIMGFNYHICGWDDIESFVSSMMESELHHLDAFVEYCQSQNLVRFLKSQDWLGFATGYNGKANAVAYAHTIAQEFEKLLHQSPPTPPAPPPPVVPGPQARSTYSNAVRSIQMVLHDEGMYEGKIDGLGGQLTFDGMVKFQRAVRKSLSKNPKR